jgi:hypothetical protein
VPDTHNKTRCFDPFPFPALEEGPLKQRIRELGERLDLHRKRQQEAHPGLTLTGMYNVLEKLRGGDLRSPSANGDRRSPPPLTAKEKQIHDQGLVTLLKQIHDELDEAVLEAYGWQDLAGTALRSGPANEMRMNDPKESPADPRLDQTSIPHSHGLPGDQSLPTDELLTRLVALNHTRAAEEKTGHIRWLRPEYQNRSGDPRSPQQTQLPGTEVSPQSKIQNHQSSIINPSSNWPERLPDQVTLIRHLLTQTPTATPAELSAHFGRKNQKRTDQIEGIIETLKGLGQV